MIENVLDKKGLVYYDSKSKKYIKDEISKTRKYCFVGSDDPNTSGWYKFASQTMNEWGDTNVTFMITSTFDKYYSGILQLQVRSDIVEDKSTQVSCPVLRWHTRIGFNPEDVMIAIDGNTYSLYVNKQCEQYGRIMAEVISESNINTSDSRIELHNSTAPETEMPEQEKTWLAKDGATVKVSNSTNQVNQIKLTDEDLDELRPDNFTMYYAAGNNSVVNSPLDAGSAFALAVYRSATGYRTQEITSLYGVKKVRYYNASVWSEWKTLAYEYGNTAILTSSGYSKYKGMYTKFATIRLNGAWSRCIGVFNVIDTESYELYGQLSFNVSTRENVSTMAVSLKWTSLSLEKFKDCIVAENESNGVMNLYFCPTTDYNTPHLSLIYCSAPSHITLYTNQSYVETVTVFKTSSLSSVAVQDSNGNIITESYINVDGSNEMEGDFITQNLLPSEPNKYNVGENQSPYKNGYFNALALRTNSSGNSYGALTAAITGTTNKEGITRLILGNSIKTGNEDNASGSIGLYGSGAGQTNIYPSNNTDETISQYLPNKSGTLALESDITSQKGVANGLAELDENGKVPSSQLPSYVDDVIECASKKDFPSPGESGKIYINTATNLSYRWSGTNYVEISPSLALGETSSTAYRGDRGKIAYEHSQLKTGNPHKVTKSDVGLGNVDNTSDLNKPISTAQQTALDNKVDKVSGKGLSTNDFTTAEKEKLAGITSGANAYTHPTTSGNKHIPSGGSAGQILRWSADGTAVWGNDNNTTYSNFVKSGSGAKAGLVPAPSTTAGTTKYLREDGTWTVPPNTTYSNMTAATSSAAGKAGLVPAPSAGAQGKFLRGDGTWQTPSNRKYCLVGSDTANTAGWYKVASQTMSGYGDANVTFVITSTFDKYHSGILQLQIRSDIQSGATVASCAILKWHTRIGFNPDDVICVINGATYTIYVNLKTTQYARIMFEVLSESSINGANSGITLHNSSTPETTAPTATVKGSDSTILYQKLKIEDDGGIVKDVVSVYNPTPDTPAAYGSEVLIGGGGNVFLGGGESMSNLRNALANADTILEGEVYANGDEQLYLSSDTDLKLYSSCNTASYRKGLMFDRYGHLYPMITGQTSNLGTSTNPWNTVYAAKGEFTGNVIGAWLQSTATNTNFPSDQTVEKICVQDSAGWIYARTPAQILSDIKALPLAGGTLTGDLTTRTVKPHETMKYDLGSSANAYYRTFLNTIALRGASGTTQSYGGLIADVTGTVDTEGVSRLILGNNVKKGTADNASGALKIYGSGTGCTNISPSNNTDNNVQLYFPDKSGTLALEGVPIFVGKGTAGTAGYIAFAQLKVTGIYVNRTIEFVLSCRGKTSTCHVCVTFGNSASTDPEIASIICTGSDYGIFAHKTATSTWLLYHTKTEAYDSISVLSVGQPEQPVEITYPGTFITTKPTENVVNSKFGGYLPLLGGGTIEGDSLDLLRIKRTSVNSAVIGFENAKDILGYVGMNTDSNDVPRLRYITKDLTGYNIIDERGGEFTGSISSKGNITGNWLQSTATNTNFPSDQTVEKICVQDVDGWIYTRTPAQILSDIGAAPTSHASTATTYGAATSIYYGHVKLTDTYGTSTGTASSGVGASAKAVYDAYSYLNSKKIQWMTLNPVSDDEITGWVIPTTEKTYATYQSRKFSDYEVLMFVFMAGGYVRNSITIPRLAFEQQNIELMYVDSANVQRCVTIARVSDTSFKIKGSSNITTGSTFGIYAFNFAKSMQ